MSNPETPLPIPPAQETGAAAATASDGWPGLLGKLDRGSYFWPLVVLLGLKFNADRFYYITSTKGRDWYFFYYLTGPAKPGEEWIVIGFTWVPIVAIALWLSVCRLRSIGAYPAWALLILVPVVQWLAFIVFSLIPRQQEPGEDSAKSWLDRWVPNSPGASAIASILVTGVGGTCLAFLSTVVLGSYGLALFVAVPFVCGFVSVALHNRHGPMGQRDVAALSLLPLVFIGIAFLVLAAEGLICLLMALPLVVILALLGGCLAKALNPMGRRTALSPTALLLLSAALPVLIGAEYAGNAQPALVKITTSVIVNAPPEVVWPCVIAFPPIPPEGRHWTLRIGIAYPIRAEIQGHGAGAIRHCIFSTGAFVEPITAWEEGRLLAFDVTAQPPSLEELTPYGHIHAPHLSGYLQSRRGQLRLEPLPGGKTLLEGTTWYTNRMWPSAYWHLWTDFIIHKIHLSVLEHIKTTTEQVAGGEAAKQL
ncbi:MAG: hypothetical protein ACAI35_18830 [Candidatus Methylacidiphilales bacterium]